jgi:hypothetical protein
MHATPQSMNNENTLRVTAPIFLLRSTESCWRCHIRQDVIALAFRWVTDRREPVNEQPRPGETILLVNIHEMPKAISQYIASVHPRFQKQLSKTTGTTYYMNICQCGAPFGDHYLFNEPGGAFFPMDVAAQSQIKVEQLPFTGEFEFDASPGMFSEDLLATGGGRQP